VIYRITYIHNLVSLR